MILTRTFSRTNETDNLRMLGAVRAALEKTFDATKFTTPKDTTAGNTENFVGRVKTKLLNPIVSLKGTYSVAVTDQSASVRFDTSTKTNGWFWFTLLLCLFFWPLILLVMWMWFSQKKKTNEALNSALNQVEFEMAALST